MSHWLIRPFGQYNRLLTNQCPGEAEDQLIALDLYKVAQVLFVTESTIKKHTSNVYKKLEVTNRTELFEKAAVYASK